MTQDELDHFVVRGFGIVCKMLEERNGRTKAGLSTAAKDHFLRYFHRLLVLKEEYMQRPEERSMHPTTIQKLDETFVDAFENLVVYFERRKSQGPLHNSAKFRTVIERFQACLTGS